MLTRCYHWELGRVIPPATHLTERLQEITHTEALLVLSKLSFPADWQQDHFCVLLDGPSRYMRVYFATAPAPASLAWQRNEQLDWLLRFKELRAGALMGEICPAATSQLQQRILQLLDWEESVLYPPLNQFLQTDRPTREMRYEHDGIRRFLPRLEAALRSDGNDGGWERFSLDLIHLMEHHLKHEGDGLYPVYERLLEAGLGITKVQ